MLVIAAGGIPTMENPQNSPIALHDRWVWLVQTLQRFGIQVGYWKQYRSSDYFVYTLYFKIYVMDWFTIEFPIASQRRTQGILSGVQGGVLDAETQGIDLEADLDLEC